ncbi:ABC transporter substrate-binding protein [Thermosulfurimonas sp. F29]|uniref:ABC transporter substrate-binding protein n=1 Tax=Thermosulfurimonas sp. F29 TaxID=2867247 RepID=UPI001C83EAF6|nr:ABC transporter substrate-binding protein [Thermosulfurimonas sp. F29]MBX6422799.1 ABC transporter substrate-binding protein [Thermosulfurimonas sp. F29]
MRLSAVFFLILTLLSPARGAKVGLLFSEKNPLTPRAVALAWEMASSFRLEGLPLGLAVYDPGPGGKKALSAVRRARSEGVSLLIGPLDPAANEAALTAARAFGLPIVLLAGDLDPLKIPGEPFRGVFRTGLSPRLAAKGILRCLAARGVKRVGLLLSLNREGRTGLKWLRIYAWEYRLRIQKTVWFGPEDTYLYPKFEDLLSAEAVIVWSDRKSAAKVARALRDYGLRIPVVFGPEVADEEFLAAHGELTGYPFPATALYLPARVRLTGGNLSPETAALVDALYLIRTVLAKGLPLTERSLEELKKVRLPGGTYYLSSDDHYGLLPESVGLFTYGPEGFRVYCAPEFP